MTLNHQQAAFVREYLIDGNATQAALRAGYSPKSAYSQGQRLLKHDEIKARLKELESRADHEYVVTKADVRKGIHHEAQNGDSSAARIRAWELLGKDIGMFTDKTEHTGGMRIEVVYVDAD